MKSRRSDACWPGPQCNDLASHAAVWIPPATEMCVILCHHFVMLCPAAVLWRTFENGSYSRISARILQTSQQLNGSLQHARKCPNAWIQSWKYPLSPDGVTIPKKNGAGDTACRDFLGTLTCHDTTNMIWRPVFGRWHTRQKFNFQPDRMQTAVHWQKNQHMCIYQPCCHDDCRDLHQGTRFADNNTRLHARGGPCGISRTSRVTIASSPPTFQFPRRT